MIYLMEFIKGILIAFGIIAGFFVTILCIVAALKNRKKNDVYEPETLITPFEKYLKKVREEEKYEQIAVVENIIIRLKSGILPAAVSLFKIKNDARVIINEEDNKTALQLEKKYIVVKMIDPTEIK